MVPTAVRKGVTDRARKFWQSDTFRTQDSSLLQGTGSSLEFQEYREYTPGDDIRHLDWAAYGRSDTLMVRLYREEISPRTEILCDASRSMSVTGPSQPTTHDEVVPPKVDLARKLTGLFALLASGLGGSPAVIPLDDSHPLERLGFDLDGWTLTDDDEMVDCDQAPGLNAVGSEPAGSTPEHTNSGGRDERD